MPLLATSAAGANGNGCGTLLAFDLDGRLRSFSDDSRTGRSRGLAVDREEGVLVLNSGADRVLALERLSARSRRVNHCSDVTVLEN